MNRFDRITSLLLLLQTRSVVTAGFLAEHFSVTERTIYRDIRTLENAGVPIGSEAGVGYFLDKGYRLPPVSFTTDEAASLLLGGKLLTASLDQSSHSDFTQALNKVRAVLDSADKDYLTSLDKDIEVLTVGQPFILQPAGEAHSEVTSGDQWLRESRRVLARRQVVDISYSAGLSTQVTQRKIEPIGLFYYSLHWHLIAWCRLREGYRDFRLDRITRFDPAAEQFPRHSRDTLQQYIAQQRGDTELQEVELLFTPEAALLVEEVRYLCGFVSDEQHDEGVRMHFLVASTDHMARWLLQYTNKVRVIKGDRLRAAMMQLTDQLASHWK